MAEIVNSAPQNESRTYVNHQHSHFPIQFSSFDTHQFGYIRPHLSVKGTSSDSLKHRPIVRTRSYTLKAPLLQDVYRKLSYFKVNLHAILPLNADKIITNPVIGSDVGTDVNCCIGSGFLYIKNAVDYQLTNSITNFNGTKNSTTLSYLIKALVFGELFYSRGSLLASLGCHLFPQFMAFASGSSDVTDYDDYFDTMIGDIMTPFASSILWVTIDGRTYSVKPYLDTSRSIRSQGSITVREFLCLIRETADWYIMSNSDNDIANINLSTFNITYSLSSDVPFNFARVAAYQLACSEFFSNDKIDFIYSAELFRQFIGDLLRESISYFYTDSNWPVNFTYNGVQYQYDYLSGKYLSMMFTYVTNSLFTTAGADKAALQYFLSLFGLKRSLRYKDYFVGSRTNPLAVGDVNVNVNSNLVNVVDVTRKIQIQRFLNFVNHTGRLLSNYVKGLFGVEIGPDRHVPQYLAELTEKVYTAEVENTGANQLTDAQTVTAVFTGNSSNKELSFGIDLESVIIGVTSYDIERAYSYSIDRDFFIKDRFDMFLPQLQFVGDQPIYKQELVSNDPSSFGSAFGYQFRDMQWKLIFSRAAGGFVGKLPGFSFMFNPAYIFGQNINSDFIRSFPTEFDDFYISLTGFALGNYFHFITWTINDLPSDRPMIANPVILE